MDGIIGRDPDSWTKASWLGNGRFWHITELMPQRFRLLGIQGLDMRVFLGSR